jgi:hypothetical protein
MENSDLRALIEAAIARPKDEFRSAISLGRSSDFWKHRYRRLRGSDFSMLTARARGSLRGRAVSRLGANRHWDSLGDTVLRHRGESPGLNPWPTLVGLRSHRNRLGRAD